MERINVKKLTRLIKENRRVIAEFFAANPCFFTAIETASIAIDAIANAAAARGRRLERINEKLIWSYPAEFREATDFLYIPVYRRTLARTEAPRLGAEPEYVWIEEIDPAPLKAISAVVIVDGSVDDIVNPKADGDVVDYDRGVAKGELHIVPIGTMRLYLGELSGIFRGYGLPRAPRRSDLYNEE